MSRQAITSLLVVDDMNAGGMERQVLELLKGLRGSATVRAVLAILKPGGQLLDEAAAMASDSVLLPFRKNPGAAFLPFRLARYARTTRADLICCFGLVSGLMGLLAGRMTGIPVINGSIRSAPLALPPKERLSLFFMKRADFVLANSEAGLSAFGLSGRPRTQVIRNGLDLLRFESVPDRSSSGWSVCMVGNFWGKKDQSTLLTAFAIVREKVPSARLALAGKDWGTLEGLRSRTHSLGMEGCVDFITGLTDTSGVISSSRVCVLLSPDGEGISNALLEYMALGKPVVATRCEGNMEVVLENRTGILVENDPGEVASAILRLLEDPALADAMGQAGRQRVKDDFSLETMIESFEQCFSSVGS